MFRNPFARVGAALSVAFALTMTGAVEAQTRPPGGVAPTTATTASRLQAQEDDRRQSQNAARRDRRQVTAPAAATPAENIAAAQAVAAATHTDCQVTEATLLGDSSDGPGKLYEASCAAGPGYIFTGSTPPQAIDCVLLEYTLAKQAAAAPAPAPAAAPAARPRRGETPAPAAPQVQRVGCKMPANLDTLGVMKAYATSAGVPCQVDAASPVGANGAGAIVYEIGCAGADGYQINKAGSTWEKTSCLALVSANAKCNFTTPEEQAATLKAWFAGNLDASACDVSQARYMGANANGSFYEAKCAAGDGVIVRFDTAMAVQQVYPCATAQRIGGGCKLTVVPDAPTTEAAPVPAA